MATSTQYDHATLSAIWAKGQVVALYDPNVYRKEVYGSWMKWSEYGQNSQYGWHVDHIVADSQGGSNSLFNLQPLHWRNNLKKSDNAW